MSASGAPKKIEGKESIKVFATEIVIINTAKIRGEVNFNNKGEMPTKKTATKFVWMPGVTPQIMPNIIPSKIAIKIPKNIFLLFLYVY